MTGADRQHFLHRVVTNDVEGLRRGDGVYACMLTPQGKIISDMTIYAREEDVLIDVEPGMATILRETLERYALIDDVEIEDVHRAVRTDRRVRQAAEACLKGLAGSLDPLPHCGNVEIEWNGLS